jgi:hypothetical protein
MLIKTLSTEIIYYLHCSIIIALIGRKGENEKGRKDIAPNFVTVQKFKARQGIK